MRRRGYTPTVNGDAGTRMLRIISVAFAVALALAAAAADHDDNEHRPVHGHTLDETQALSLVTKAAERRPSLFNRSW